MEIEKLKATPRTELGTRNTRRAREAGRIPAVIYGHKQDPEPVSLDAHDAHVALLHGARVLELDLGGKMGQYLVKQIQHDYRGDVPIHLDLMRVDLDERVTVSVDVELRGVPKGIAEGGELEQLLNEIEVECVVTQIPETLHPVVTHLGVGEALCIKDLELPDGVTTTNDPEDKIALVRMKAAAEEAEAEEPVEEAEKGQPEVIGRTREEADGAGG